MEMCSSKSLECPLCCHANFADLDALRSSLVKVTSNPLKCPICDEIIVGGLDKLTIHLFGHTLPIVEQLQKTKNSKKTPTTSVAAPAEIDPKCLDAVKRKLKSKHGADSKKNIPSLSTPSSTQAVSVYVPDTTAPASNGLELRAIMPNEAMLTASQYIHNPYNNNYPQHQQLRQQQTASVLPSAVDLYDKSNKFQCNICGKYYSKKSSLNVHIRLEHLSPITKKKTAAVEQGSVSVSMPESQYSTLNSTSSATTNNIIVIAANDDNALARNLPGPSGAGGMRGALMNGEEDAAPRANNSPKSPKPDIKLWVCDTCKKPFTTKYFLKKHKRLHTGEMPYTCKLCDKPFTFQQSYHKHLLYHSDEKNHICTVCNRAFKELSTLNNHIRIHSGEKPFQCETCAKCFRQRVSYLVHRRIHTGQMPYKCTACDKSFRYKVSQRTHKCLSQPPGTVVRQTGDLLQKLLQCSAITPSFDDIDSSSQINSIKSSDNCSDTQDDENNNINKGDEANFTQTLDELVKESYEKMGMDEPSTYNNIEMNDIINLTTIDEERFRNLCLTSPIMPDENFAAININEHFL